MTPARYLARCAFDCGQPVDTRPGHGAYREVTGWEPIRLGGGGNTVALPERTGRYAHNTCVHLAKQSKDWEQPELFV